MLVDGVHRRTLPSSPIPWNATDFIAAVDHAFEKTSDISELRTLFADIFIVGVKNRRTTARDLLDAALLKVSRTVLLDFSKHWIQGEEKAGVRVAKSPTFLRKAKYHKVH
jgi:hypothetical protein